MATVLCLPVRCVSKVWAHFGILTPTATGALFIGLRLMRRLERVGRPPRRVGFGVRACGTMLHASLARRTTAVNGSPTPVDSNPPQPR